MKEKMKRKAFPISLQKRKEEQMICCSYHQKGQRKQMQRTNYVKNMKPGIRLIKTDYITVLELQRRNKALAKTANESCVVHD
jgi:hypothetical protein